MIIGYYDHQGYRIESNGRELYTTGNHPLESATILDADDPIALPLKTIRKYCRKSAKEISTERNEPFIGIERMEE